MRIVEAFLSAVPNCIGAANFGDGTYRLDFVGSSRLATVQETAAAQAVIDAEATAAAQLAALRTQAVNAIARLQEIQAANAPTNAQVVAAVKDLAQIQERVIKVVFQTLG